VLYALSYTDVLKQQTFLQEGSGSMDDDGGLVCRAESISVDALFP
jgi:hypothetical protein